MLIPLVGLIALFITLAGFAVVGVRARRRDDDLDAYLVARNSRSGLSIGLSLLASGLGAWVLLSPAEIGAFVGVDAAIGYGIASALPLLLLIWLGRRVRRLLPDGLSLMAFLKVRFGRTFHAYVTGVAIAYMATYMIAELTAVGSVGQILSGLDPTVTITGVAAITLGYTAYGGLPASLTTDRWQAWLVLALAAVAGTAVLANLDLTPGALTDTGLTRVHGAGIETSITLVLAVTAAELLNHGNWQRVWAARDDVALRRGVIMAAVVVGIAVAAGGVAGTLAIAAGVELGDPPVPFFALLTGLPSWLLAFVLVLTVALVASSVDTLENALASLIVAERPSMGLRTARIVTVVLVIPAALVALRGYSVLRLFLIADLLAATVVVPALLSLWQRTTPPSALAGALAGIAGAVLAGVVANPTWADALAAITFAGTPTLPPFAGAVLASGAVTLTWSFVAHRQVDLEAAGAAVPASR